ncbi:PQQ-dependent dehydrogenase, methanol/ethanol family [Croceicoccus ponticola]|uniref:PQQ-dependent dehydrogenase, methanol/ethanol family n=2 Tax=Croceicoccus ponticola TaxID=2217664 RepID=A0A437H2A9_9SPHN|nr:PQQ-dependent dehydrogenase, methanol/ethanol family [Croceicoccus ponticola]
MIAAACLSTCTTDTPEAADPAQDAANWTGFGGNSDEQHYSALDQIDADNVGELGLVWSMDLPQQNSVSAPLAVDGVLYTATGYSVVRAIDAVTGKLLWEYDPQVPEAAGRKLRQGWGIRGLAYGEGRLYVGTHDGRLLGINAKDGTLAWSAQTLPKDNASFISGPARYFDGKVIIGFGGGDVSDVRGYVTAYDAKTGSQLWRFWTVPGNPSDGFENKAMEMAAKTWAGEWWKYGGGGTVWNAMTYDRSTNSMILGVGNGSPWNHKIRSEGKGDNLFLASIVALDADTGEYKWHYQVNPGESWDYNASMDMELADLDIGGQQRKVLMTAPKNGFFYVIDRTTGKLISAEPFVKVSWASKIDLKTGRPVENPDARYADGKTFTMWPGPVGAHTWLPMAYNPKTRLVYIPAIEMATSYNDVGIERKNWKRTPGNAVDGGANPNFVVPDAGPTNATSALIAWDPVTQKQVWKVPTPGPWNGGIMTTAGNLVFQGRIDGTFDAYAADTGKKVWSFAAQAPVTAPPISYSVNGKQYVTVITGMGTSGSAFGTLLPVSIDYRTQARRILTFAIGGKGTLPKQVATPVEPVADPDYTADAALELQGLMKFARQCAVCHGVDAIAAGHAPDLRASSVPLDAAAFASVVRDGILVPNGMPRFEEYTDADLAAVRQYIRAEAAKWRTTAKPQK